jgi:chorismate-pyruvate lyase
VVGASTVTAFEPVDLEETLLGRPHTVTHILETLTAETLSAEVIRQGPVAAGVDDALAVSTRETLTHRTAVLRGWPSGLPYLYAESAFVPERLPDGARHQLERSCEPIGRVLVAHGLNLARETLPRPERPYPASAVTAGGQLGIVWARAYRLMVDGAPVFAIKEWFFRSVLDALDRSAAT